MLCSNITWFQITFLLLIKLFIYLFHPWQLAQIKQVLFCLSKTECINSLSRDFGFIITHRLGRTKRHSAVYQRCRGAGRPETCRLSQSTCPSVTVRIPSSSSCLAPWTRSSAWPTKTPCGPCSPLRGTASTTGRPSSSWPPGAACWSAGWCWADFTSLASPWWPPRSWPPLCCLWGWWCWWWGWFWCPSHDKWDNRAQLTVSAVTTSLT